MKNKESGITLIALVITIIVLLILAGVTIASLTGQNNLLVRAENSRNETNRAAVEEELQLLIQEELIRSGIDPERAAAPILEKIMTSETINDLEELEEDLAEDEKDGKPIITGKYKGYKFEIDENGKATVQEKETTTPDDDGSGGDNPAGDGRS